MFDNSESSDDGGWISWFCDLEGHEFFVEVATHFSHCLIALCVGRSRVP
jgi:hypothetical protein